MGQHKKRRAERVKRKQDSLIERLAAMRERIRLGYGGPTGKQTLGPRVKPEVKPEMKPGQPVTVNNTDVPTEVKPEVPVNSIDVPTASGSSFSDRMRERSGANAERNQPEPDLFDDVKPDPDWPK